MVELDPGLLAAIALQVEEAAPSITTEGAAAIAVGLAALGTGYAQRGIGAAAVGAIAEDRSAFGLSLVFVAIPETLIIIAFITVFIVI